MPFPHCSRSEQSLPLRRFVSAWRGKKNGSVALQGSWVNRWFMLRHPALLAVVLAVLAGLNGWVQPYGLKPTIVKERLEVRAPAAEEWNSFSRVRAEHA